MNNRSYYALPADIPLDIQAGSRQTDEAPLVVNCAGSFETAFSFQTDNPRGREDYYLMLVLKGELRVCLSDEDYIATGGTLLIFPPHYHYCYTYTNNTEPLHYLWVHFSGSHAEHYLRAFGFCSLPVAQICAATAEAVAIFEAMFQAFSQGGSIRDAVLGCHLERLLLSFATEKKTQSTKPCLISRSLAYIDAHYTEPVSVPALARLERLSYSRYHDVFVKEVGCPPSRYVTRKRIDHARELLLSTDMSVQQIGAQVGYTDPHFFSKTFKKELGCSPLVYRKQNEG